MIENYFNTQKRGILPKDDSLIRMMKYREKPLSLEEGREPKEMSDLKLLKRLCCDDSGIDSNY